LLLDISEHLAKIGYRARRVTEFQSPYFAQTVRTSSSVANSRRSAWASDSRNEASSSDVSFDDGLILTGQFQQHASKVVLHFRRQPARNVHRMLEKLGKAWSWQHHSTTSLSEALSGHNRLSVDLQRP
jgi:hypothetical protein